MMWLFGQKEILPPRGLRMHAPIGKKIDGQPGIQFATYTGLQGQSGAEVSFHNIRFTLDLSADNRVHRADDIGSLKVYHPGGIWFQRSDSAFAVYAGSRGGLIDAALLEFLAAAAGTQVVATDLRRGA